ncbi:MAG TPA: hypothetical protein VIQ30_26915 [Pseudonocardia sp.]
MKVTAARWMRPVVATAAASGLALTLGVGSAAAADSQPSSCAAAGYRATAKVTYHRTATETFIDNVSVNVDKRAGAHNRVRIVVKDGDTTVFYYASQNTVTAGPFLFDYTDNPIPTHQRSPSDPLIAQVTFDFDRGTGGTGSSSAPSPDGAEADGPDSAQDGDDPDGADSDDGGDVGDPGTSGHHKRGKHSDADPASYVTSPAAAAPTRCTATVRF